MAAEPSKPAAPKSGEATKDAEMACMNMMQGPGMTEEGMKAISPRTLNRSRTAKNDN